MTDDLRLETDDLRLETADLRESTARAPSVTRVWVIDSGVVGRPAVGFDPLKLSLLKTA